MDRTSYTTAHSGRYPLDTETVCVAGRVCRPYTIYGSFSSLPVCLPRTVRRFWPVRSDGAYVRVPPANAPALFFTYWHITRPLSFHLPRNNAAVLNALSTRCDWDVSGLQAALTHSLYVGVAISTSDAFTLPTGSTTDRGTLSLLRGWLRTYPRYQPRGSMLFHPRDATAFTAGSSVYAP